MKFRNKITDSLTRVTVRMPSEKVNKIRTICSEKNWVPADLYRYGLDLFLKEYDMQHKNEPKQKEMF